MRTLLRHSCLFWIPWGRLCDRNDRSDSHPRFVGVAVAHTETHTLVKLVSEAAGTLRIVWCVLPAAPVVTP